MFRARDYPRDLIEFEARFGTEEACRDYLFGLRWPDSFRCPACGHETWPVRKVWWQCARREADVGDRRHVQERANRCGCGSGRSGT